jgi:broad specificity phosphatase PhoE
LPKTLLAYIVDRISQNANLFESDFDAWHAFNAEDTKESMVRFVLIRPGSTDFDEQGRIQGTLDIPLSDRGAAEATRIATELKSQNLSALYSAPCQSASQTAAAIGQALGLKPKKLDKLQNLDHGLWQGMLIEEVKHKQPKVYRQWQDNPWIVCPPEGEMLSHAEDRIRTAIAKLLKKHRGTAVGLVLPEPLASVVHSFLTRAAVGDLWECCSAHGAWEVLSIENPGVPSQELAVKYEMPAGGRGPLPLGSH